MRACFRQLDFEEFYAMQPVRLRDEHSAAEIRTWFDAADSDGDGVLSCNEFFLTNWSFILFNPTRDSDT